MDRRPHFRIERADFRERLVWRYADQALRDASVSRNLTLGYYREHDGGTCFMPAPTSAALRALEEESVQIRIADDLRLRNSERERSSAPGRRYILNSAVVTAPGSYVYRLLSDDKAREWIGRGEFVSTVGYEQTAAALSRLLGVDIPVNRRTIAMQPRDQALVFRLVLPAGAQRIDPADKGRLDEALLAGQYELGLLTRVR